jgi:hypothetical protein
MVISRKGREERSEEEVAHERSTELGRRDGGTDEGRTEAPGSLDRFMTEGSYRNGIRAMS